jgi:hypothetical protein
MKVVILQKIAITGSLKEEGFSVSPNQHQHICPAVSKLNGTYTLKQSNVDIISIKVHQNCFLKSHHFGFVP